MRKILISSLCGAALAAAAPANAVANPALVNKLAAGACSAEKSKLGKKAFAKRYAGKKPKRICIKRKKPEARRAVSEATDECLWELQEYGEEEFYFEWGTFSACVDDYSAWIMDGGSFEDDTSEDGEDEEEDDGLF
jgi:hypothetical protein